MDPDTLAQRSGQMIRRRVAGGATEAESSTMLAEFLATAGKGFMPTALHYNGFATARAAEAFTEAYFADSPSEGPAGAGEAPKAAPGYVVTEAYAIASLEPPAGERTTMYEHQPPGAATAAADITVEHSAEGTLVHGTTRGDHDAAQALRANGFRWSRNLDAWYLPHNLTHETRDRKVAALQAALGDRVEVEIPDAGRRLTAVEKETAKQERAANRAERMSAKAEKMEACAEAHRGAADRISENIPFGQPILVGHHSEGRARRDAERILSNIDKSLGYAAGAQDAQAAAYRAERTATGSESVVTITNRIERNEGLVRKVDRELAAHETAQSIIDKVGADHPKIQAVGTAQLGLRSAERLAQLGHFKAQALDAIGHDRAKLDAAGGVTYGKHNVSPGDIIVSRSGGYTPVIRANAKSATVPTGYSWTDTVQWSKVTKVIEAEKFTPDQVRQILEAVEPTDKHRLAAFEKTLARAEAAASTHAAADPAHAAPPEPQPAKVTYVPVSYQNVDFARMPDGSVHRLTYDDTNPYALHAEIHAIAADQQIGKVHWTPGYGNATVDVDPDRRHQGIGTRLMREAVAADPSAGERWTPVTAAGQAFGRKLGLNFPSPTAAEEPPAHGSPSTSRSSAFASTAWSCEDASLLEGLDGDAAAPHRLSGRQGLPQATTASAPAPGRGR